MVVWPRRRGGGEVQPGHVGAGGVRVAGSGSAMADAAALANSGVLQVGRDLVVGRGPAARSAYREQVRRIAPKELLDRERELAELAAFCTHPERGPYVWWRAEAWAGKSALLSWFVLHPPPGVVVVSFFITARFRGQDDSVAFAEVVLEQLAELLGEPIPALLTEATREPHLLRMLAEAADACHRRGQRLVLVVDGLDEDRGDHRTS
jgi:hypothetical protein